MAGEQYSFVVLALDRIYWTTISYRRLVGRFRETEYWAPFVKTLKFILHFVLVMAILFCGALVLAILEDPEVSRL